MPLSPGDKLGPYTILALAGKGGMGEVYRAHDDRLRRDVAIKVSSSQFTERFTREARTIASLNHTNIAHLYDVGPNYLVMEYVEGEDLKGPLEFEDALPIIQQLIDGIEAAHEKNIIHRDLKPANIKITPEGVVKILDFGLAKAMEPPADIDPENSPTLTMGGTVAGTILGTAAYMAPEQAKGKAADKRADIWSFGVVVYEMLTGKRLFQGESVVEILGGVLNKEPDFSAAPPRVHKLLAWCLEKDRKQRLAAIGDARRLLMENDATSAIARVAGAWIPWLVAGAAAVALGIALWAPWRTAAPEQPHVRFQVQPPEKGGIAFPRLSPDGRLLAFSSNNQLWVHSFETLESHAIAGTEGASISFWSPDSTHIGFFAQGSLKRIALSGGPARTLTPAPGGLGGTWSKDDVILYSPSLSLPLYRIPAGGGDPVVATKVEGSEFHLYPEFLPDGNHFLYLAVGGKAGVAGILVGSLDGSPPVHLLPQASNARFSQGHLLYGNGDTLMARPFDAAALKFTGDAFPVVEHVYQNLGYYAFSASGNGMLTYLAGAVAQVTQLGWKDRSGKTGALFGPPGDYARFRLSPDEKQIVYDVKLEDVWVLDAVRGVPSRLTFDPEQDNVPMWSADGSKVVWPSHRSGSFDLYVKAANGTGQDQLLVKMGTPNGWGTDWSKDGHVMFQRPGEGTGQDLWFAAIDAAGAAGKPEPYLNTSFDEGNGQFSPDSKWVAYTSNETGLKEVFVQSFPVSGAKFQISTGGGSEPQWSKDGRELFYIAGDRTLMAVPVTKNAADPFRPGLAARLFNVGISMGDTLTDRSYAVSNDGRRFLVPIGEGGGSRSTLTMLLNWRRGFKL